MAMFLSSSDPDFESRFDALLSAKRETSQEVDDTVKAIISDVRARGDAALVEYTHRFDRMDIDASGLRVDAETVELYLDIDSLKIDIGSPVGIVAARRSDNGLTIDADGNACFKPGITKRIAVLLQNRFLCGQQR